MWLDGEGLGVRRVRRVEVPAHFAAPGDIKRRRLDAVVVADDDDGIDFGDEVGES